MKKDDPKYGPYSVDFSSVKHRGAEVTTILNKLVKIKVLKTRHLIFNKPKVEIYLTEVCTLYAEEW